MKLSNRATLLNDDAFPITHNKSSQMLDLTSFGHDFWDNSNLTINNINSSDLDLYGNLNGEHDLILRITKLFNSNYNDITITSGASESLLLSLWAILNPFDSVILPKPYFPAYSKIIELLGAENSFYNANDEEKALIEIQEQINSKTKVIIINSPNNPTGYVYSNNFINKILDLAINKNIFILLDMTYSWILNNSLDLTKFKSSENIIRVVSLGKYIGIPRLRLGTVISTHIEFTQSIREIKRHIIQSSSIFDQSICLSILNQLNTVKLRQEKAIKKLMSRKKTLLDSARDKFILHSDSYNYNWDGFYTLINILDSYSYKQLYTIKGEYFGVNKGQNYSRICLGSSDEEWEKFTKLILN